MSNKSKKSAEVENVKIASSFKVLLDQVQSIKCSEIDLKDIAGTYNGGMFDFLGFQTKVAKLSVEAVTMLLTVFVMCGPNYQTSVNRIEVVEKRDSLAPEHKEVIKKIRSMESEILGAGMKIKARGMKIDAEMITATRMFSCFPGYTIKLYLKSTARRAWANGAIICDWFANLPLIKAFLDRERISAILIGQNAVAQEEFLTFCVGLDHTAGKLERKSVKATEVTLSNALKDFDRFATTTAKSMEGLFAPKELVDIWEAIETKGWGSKVKYGGGFAWRAEGEFVENIKENFVGGEFLTGEEE